MESAPRSKSFLARLFDRLLAAVLADDKLTKTLRGVHRACRQGMSFDDFRQGVLCRALQYRDSFRSKTRDVFGAWLRRIARQQAVNHGRQVRRERLVPLPGDLVDGAETPSATRRGEQRLAWLTEALATLKADERALLVQHFYHSRSWADIARELDKKPNTVRHQATALLRALRNQEEF